MKTPALLCCLLAIAATLPAQAAAPADVLGRSEQLLVVTTASQDAVDGSLQRFERGSPDRPWRAVGDPVAIVVGKNGLAWGSGLATVPAASPVKREGDGRSPAGVFALGTAFGYADAAPRGARLPYLPLTAAVECVDDPASAHYNRVVARNTVTADWSSSERMRAMGESYRWGIVVDHNHIAAAQDGPQPVPQGGSCIFLHVWSGPGHGTAGCTAMAQSAVELLLAWLDPQRHPLLVQLTATDYAQLRNQWALPEASTTTSP